MQVIDTPAIEKIYKDKNLKFLFKGLLDVADLVVVCLDAIDCDFRSNAIGRVLKKNKKEFLIVLNKCDMFDTESETSEQMDFVGKQIIEVIDNNKNSNKDIPNNIRICAHSNFDKNKSKELVMEIENIF